MKEEFVDTKGVMKITLKRNLLDRMVVEFTTTYAISAYHHWCCEFKSLSGWGVQHYVIKFVSDLWQVSGFLWVRLFPPPIKLTATIKLKYCWNSIKTNKQQYNLLHFVLKLLIYIWFRHILHITNGLIDWPKFVKVMRNSICQWLM